IATFEHSTFVQGAMFGLNSFDQWGVELGKQLAAKVAAGINGTPDSKADSSTSSLIAQHRRWRNPR
ncbi:MAG: glucose-6-phosphate isomerase, partial [Actinobacteria bacterium]|nr:glucose-6-phosphate isomerase [Actinomycetota bacterium]